MKLIFLIILSIGCKAIGAEWKPLADLLGEAVEVRAQGTVGVTDGPDHGVDALLKDPRAVARVVDWVKRIRAKDSGIRYGGQSPHPSTRQVVDLRFVMRDKTQLRILIIRRWDVVVNQDISFRSEEQLKMTGLLKALRVKQ